MKNFLVRFYRTAGGNAIVANKLQMIQAREPMAWAAIRTRLTMLENEGPVGKGFTQLRHTEGSVLWELRTQSRPAYRLLFAPVPGKAEYVILLVARKDDMDKQHLKNQRIEQALTFFHHWLEEVNRDGEE